MSYPSHPHSLLIFLCPFFLFSHSFTSRRTSLPPTLSSFVHSYNFSITFPIQSCLPLNSSIPVCPLYPCDHFQRSSTLPASPPLLSFLPHFLVVLLPLSFPPIPTFNSSLVPPSLWTSFLTESWVNKRACC